MDIKKKQVYYATSPEIEVIPMYLENGEIHSYIIQARTITPMEKLRNEQQRNPKDKSIT
jgi:hypothetical protein